MSQREESAIQNVRAFSIFASGKLAPHVVEDLRIVCTLAAQAIEAETDETRNAAQPEGRERGPKGAPK